MKTREEYKNEIERAAEQRLYALKQITSLTLDEFDNNEIIDWAYQAHEAYRYMTHLKAEMREIYTTQCTCQCVNHRTEE